MISVACDWECVVDLERFDDDLGLWLRFIFSCMSEGCIAVIRGFSAEYCLIRLRGGYSGTPRVS